MKKYEYEVDLIYQFGEYEFTYHVAESDFLKAAKELKIYIDIEKLEEVADEDREEIKDYFLEEVEEAFRDAVAEQKDPYDYYGISRRNY